ncbi:bacteriocin biosynthesis protein SagD [Paenibacillus sp. H1-7]|uniref:TOMM precursor leader peptide-binding protein n=1 Tax=Paenibacillus sp. H1-7 TaxID=2282849 RepID=UPI001EF8EF16|nr:TOMM precursor leader peptide-binding protein [Paenibacillus sp. H1-7]ULL13570.1 bacteriocin biosynthesis protein SagD [Paenibacillus sp. H1-7]
MKKRIVIAGDGSLSDYVGEELSRQEVEGIRLRMDQLTDGLPDEAGLALLLQEGWQPQAVQHAEERFSAARIPWLRGAVVLGEGVIGPWVIQGEPGCPQCTDSRRLMAGRERREMQSLLQALAAQGGTQRDVWAAPIGLLHMAKLIAAEVREALNGLSGKRKGRLMRVNLLTLETSSHTVLPDSLCPACSRPVDDTPEQARMELRPSPKLKADSFRTRSMDELQAVLGRDYVDHRAGLLNGSMVDLTSPFADASVNLPLLSEDVGAAGRTHSYAVSGSTAILEGLERYSSLQPRSKRTVVYGSYRELAEQALNPLTVGVHSKEQYALPNYPFRPFDPEETTPWVWGYSFLQERPILVPESLAYYSMGCGSQFVFESSNGCALGGSLEEAILYGILEVAERDSFLMAWYAQLPLPRLDLGSAADLELQQMIDRLETVAGFEVMFFNSTMEYGIPSVWGIARNKREEGARLICAAGAHPDPLRAVKGALHELGGMMPSLDMKLQANREDAVRMLRDSSQVKSMEDHSLLYGLPEAEQRLGFLLDGGSKPLKFEEAFPLTGRRNTTDLTDELVGVLQRFNRLNLDVVAIDVTAPELARNKLHCVKVLIPGTLPMTFGHHYTRLAGLDRVFRVPMELGFTKQPLTPGQLNPFPHPFP